MRAESGDDLQGRLLQRRLLWIIGLVVSLRGWLVAGGWWLEADVADDRTRASDKGTVVACE